MVHDKDMPSSSTIFRWLLDEDKKDFWEQYEKARNIRAENMFEELSIVGDSAEPKSIAELATLGVNVMLCTKGADSVDLGIKQRSARRMGGASDTRAGKNGDMAGAVSNDGDLAKHL
jgi:hypothetical protein